MHPLIELCAKVLEEAAKDNIPRHAYLHAAQLLRSLPQSEIDKAAGEAVAHLRLVAEYHHNPAQLDYGVEWLIEGQLPHGTKLYAAPAAPPVTDHAGHVCPTCGNPYAAALPDGYVRVPKVATQEMIEAAGNYRMAANKSSSESIYAVMIDAYIAAAQGERK